MAATKYPSLSPLPTPDELEAHRGQWVALHSGRIVAADVDVDELRARLDAVGVTADRLILADEHPDRGDRDGG